MVAYSRRIANPKRRFLLDKKGEMAFIMGNFPGGGTMRSIFLVLAVTVGLISGCSSTDVIVKKQMEMDSRLEQLVQGNTAANAGSPS